MTTQHYNIANTVDNFEDQIHAKLNLLQATINRPTSSIYEILAALATRQPETKFSPAHVVTNTIHITAVDCVQLPAS